MKIALLIALLVLVVFGIAPVLVLSIILYRIILVRTSPNKWGRECSMPDDEEYKRMYDLGAIWEAKFHANKEEVHVVSDGFRLYGEYFDFGYDRAAIIIPGRTEASPYCYFFAETYQKAGYNVLAIDNRSHGFSEGRRVSLGFKEYRDILKWGEMLHERGNEAVVLHGICIGASTALFALTSPGCPSYMKGMVSEGMYTTFAESFKNHMIEGEHALFPLFYVTMFQILVLSGANVMTDGPIKRISLLDRPILFLHSKEDIYSLPEKAEELYDLCTADKKLVWYETSGHSRIRINYMEDYDARIEEFLREKIAPAGK